MSEEETPAEIQVSLKLTERADEQEVVSEDKPVIEQSQSLHETEAVHVSEEETPAEIQVSLELTERADEQEVVSEDKPVIEQSQNSHEIEA